MTKTKRTRRSIQIAAIAEQIATRFDPRFYSSLEEFARETNDSSDGWTVDVGYGHENPGNWTRTTGIELTDVELAEAVLLAGALVADGWR